MYICNKCRAIYKKNESGNYVIQTTKHCPYSTTCGECSNNIIEIDDEIVPAILSLWWKGYQTVFSCSGHPITNTDELNLFTIDTYILIDISNLKSEFVDHIVNDIYNAKNYDLVEIEITNSILNNINTKCIRIGLNIDNDYARNVIDLTYGAHSVTSVPLDRISIAAYSCLCKIRGQIADFVNALPAVTHNDLIDPTIHASNGNRRDYDCKYDKTFVDRMLSKFPSARKDVLTFISAVSMYGYGHETEKWISPIEDLFANGFCYYFAVILHNAFGGTIVWHEGYGHILWMDENKIVYDIYGVYDGDIAENFIPIDNVDPEVIESFKHNRLL